MYACLGVFCYILILHSDKINILSSYLLKNKKFAYSFIAENILFIYILP